MSEQSWGPAKHYEAVHIDLDAVDALCAAATPGPWHRDPIYWSLRIVEKGGYDVTDGLPEDVQWPCRDDADFIAAARTLVPQLLARVRELEAVGEHDMEPPPNARELVEQMRKEVGCGMMQAKQALEDEDWNYDDAKEALRYAGTTRGRPALIERLRRRIRALEAGPDDAACDRVIEAIWSCYHDTPKSVLRARMVAALKGE